MEHSGAKVCVITGGSSGMGLATAHRMGKKGYRLVLAARTPAKLDHAIAALFAAVSDPAMGYLTGTDILCDGGFIAGGARALRR